MTSLFDQLEKKIEAEIKDISRSNQDFQEYVFRVIFIYGRSNVKPTFIEGEQSNNLLRRSNFFFDVLYLHDKQTKDNCPQEIFDSLLAVERDDSNNLFYETSASLKKILYYMAHLLANPSQRTIDANLS